MKSLARKINDCGIAVSLALVAFSAGAASGSGNWPVLREYRGECLRRVAMPMGGVGTGTISLSGRGGLEAFEIRNSADKKNIPCRQSVHPAFVIRTKDENGTVVARLLEGPLDKSLYEGAFGCEAPNHGYPRFAESVFRAAYPLAEVELSDPGMPVAVTLQAMNPLVKGDEEASGIPVVMARWSVVNKSSGPLSVTVAAAMPNPCGGTLSQERVVSAALCGVVFRGNADKPGDKNPLNRTTGEFAMTVPAGAGDVTVGANVGHAGWSDGLDQFWRRLVEKGDVGDITGREKCDFGMLAVSVVLKPGETKTIPFALSWRFPNRTQWEWTENGFYEKINHVGNHYCEKFPTALAAAETFFARLSELESRTVEFVRSVVDAKGVPDVVKEAALFNLSTLRSPTCFRTADGHFFGWEGTGDSFGSCYGNCTHVWGYEHALVDIWPALAKDMRDLEFRHAMSDEGAISFRIGQPIDRNARQHDKAAADGQMQCIVKAYECWAKTGDDEWMRSLYPLVRKALEFSWVKGGWDADRDGVMEGCQHNTMDVDYYGPNPQMEFLYLAALQAMERLASKFDADGSFAAKCAELRAKGSAWTEKNLFNGEWYEHSVASAEGEFHPATKASWTKLADPKNPDFQLGPGCLVDQLVGDYAARAAGLDPVADFAHARKATETILKRNRREPDAPLFNHMRDFALAGERSLVMAWYPPARRPKTPFPYYPESMTGFEYVVAAWLAQTGDFAAAEEVVRDIRNRYDGEKRSPFDEAECGHHYARALAAWSVYKAFVARDYRIVAADQSTSSLVMVSGAPGAQTEILWRWDSRKDSKILPTYRNSFRNIDECKPSADGSEILANASCGGVAAVDVATASVKWYAYLPKWNAGPHSLCVLPDGKVAVANSTGVDALQIIDVSAAPLDPARQKVVKAMSLPGAHGVVWDARRGSLFALGYTNLYELAYSSADMSVSVKRSWDYSAKLCDQYGHDLVADGSGGYFLTNHTAVWHLDPDADRWTKVRDIANVKSFSRDAKKGDLITIAKEKWWTDELKIIEPDGTTRVVGPFPGARFYKARWM